MARRNDDSQGVKNKTEYEVGYKKPPKHTQFKKGTSGNPKGRPKGAKNLKTDLAEELREQIEIQENGKPKKISKQRGIMKSVINKALKGDIRAANLSTQLIQTHLAENEGSRDEEEPLSSDDREILEDLFRRSQSRDEPASDDESSSGGAAR